MAGKLDYLGSIVSSGGFIRSLGIGATNVGAPLPHGPGHGHGPGLGGLFVPIFWLQGIREGITAFAEQFAQDTSWSTILATIDHLPIATFTGLVVWGLFMPLSTVGMLGYFFWSWRQSNSKVPFVLTELEHSHSGEPAVPAAHPPSAGWDPAEEILDACLTASMVAAMRLGKLPPDAHAKMQGIARRALYHALRHDSRVKALTAALLEVSEKSASKVL